MDFSELISALKASPNRASLQELLLMVPSEDRFVVLNHLGWDFIDSCIKSVDELAQFIRGFPDDEAAALLSFMYFCDQEGFETFCAMVQDFEQLSTLMSALAKESLVLVIDSIDHCIIQDYKQLNIVLGLLGDEEACAKLLRGYGPFLANMMEGSDCDDVAYILESVPQALRFEILSNMGQDVFTMVCSEIENIRLMSFISTAWHLAVILQSLDQVRLQDFLVCINHADFYQSLIHNADDLAQVLSAIMPVTSNEVNFILAIEPIFRAYIKDKTDLDKLSLVTKEDKAKLDDYYKLAPRILSPMPLRPCQPKHPYSAWLLQQRSQGFFLDYKL